ncbi:hypothetical protein FHS04_002792 [Mesoflavibacter sabulilitoris]|uniref:Uncharacterized protein n=1 Tax=Mesoflavibacter zeaxanthinifaciens subsp. sabulilitoris TaxID=1520893 RepID=A0A2T1NNL7_9FLAO|nr:hypothetical protein [Mesoflavibacter zeaxanthinifaciens]MBB3125248.1 hypothetical protein [Mesoflavibacter zeaxanthinifaciens subsp. sabulilitoris]PSG94483.1 hypothetical protein C7H61_00690 [Mesoflavibacter zeaxanthinifaciens subsp. sabulilitoris]
MGWISFTYTEKTHLEFNITDAYLFCYKEYNRNSYEIIRFWFQPTKNIQDNHVVYLVLKHPDGYNFILVVLINIENEEIYFKEISGSMGPAEDKCPIEFLSLVKLPKTNSYEYDWFIKVKHQNIKSVIQTFKHKNKVIVYIKTEKRGFKVCTGKPSDRTCISWDYDNYNAAMLTAIEYFTNFIS